MPGSSKLQRWQNGCRPDSVTVNFSLCRKARMEFCRGGGSSQDTDRRRQQSVEDVGPTLRCQALLRKIDMCALSESVHTGIGSPGAMNTPALFSHSAKRAFQNILHGVAVRLALPTCKCRSVVRDNELQPLRHFDYREISSPGTALRWRSR